MTTKRVWTARCKSGYQYLVAGTAGTAGASGKLVYRECRRAAGRGHILCSECASAEVVPQLVLVPVKRRVRVTWRERVAVAVMLRTVVAITVAPSAPVSAC